MNIKKSNDIAEKFRIVKYKLIIVYDIRKSPFIFRNCSEKQKYSESNRCLKVFKGFKGSAKKSEIKYLAYFQPVKFG